MANLFSTNINSILNVTQDIANTGNCLVTQNTAAGNLIITQNASFGNISIIQNSTFGNVNITPTFNASWNIANTGNILITQNTATGNLSITQNLTVGNGIISSVMNVYGIIDANGSPTKNLVTTPFTGLSAFLTANTGRTSNATMNAENNLAITINETGVYLMGGNFEFNAKSNGFSGIQFDFGGGTAKVNAIAWGASGWVNGAPNTQPLITANNTALQFSNIDVTATRDFISIVGLITINATGTLIPRYAQKVSTANAANLAANSFWTLTKIG